MGLLDLVADCAPQDYVLAKPLNDADSLWWLYMEQVIPTTFFPMLEPSDVKTDNTLAELGIDSLGLVESIFAIEERFDITVPFNANDPKASEFDISSVAAIIAAVEKLKAEQVA